MKSFILLLFVALLWSCNSDDNEPKNNNSILINGESINIVSASILGVAMDGSGHAGITLTSGDQTEAKILTMDVSYAGDNVVVGEYSFPSDNGATEMNDWLTNYTIQSGNSFETEHLESGAITVIDNGNDNYTIDMDLIMDGGTVIKGSYTGDFQVMFNNG